MTEKIPTVTETTAELYKIRGLPHLGWADITIDAAEHYGRISVSSDWGNFANFWSHCGRPFKEFLAEVDIHYFAGKIKKDNWFDHRRTMKGIRLDVLERRKDESLTKEDARIIWDLLPTLEDRENEGAFNATTYECDALWKMYGGESPARYGIDPGFRAFWEVCWPVFIEYLKNEVPPIKCGKDCAAANEYEIGKCGLIEGHTGACYGANY